MKKDSSVFKKNKDVVARDFEEETVLVPIFRTSKEADYIYSLNPEAKRIWDLINGKRASADIKKIILNEYAITPDEADKKINNILKDFKKIKAIK